MLQAKICFFLLTVVAFAAPGARADSCGPSQNHTAATAVKELAEALYAPFADYPFKPEGVCIDPDGLQVLANVYFRSTDGTAPEIESLCVTRPGEGDLQIRWKLGPTPEAALLVASGQNEEIVRSHDFWHIQVPGQICSKTLQLRELVLERSGGLDVKLRGNNAEIHVHGIALNAVIEKPRFPAFLSQGIGVNSLIVKENDIFEANFTVPFFNIPISAIGDFGPQDHLSVDVFGIHFRVK